MHQTKKGDRWHFGMKAHFGVDDDSGYTGADRRVRRKKLEWRIAARRGNLEAMADGRANPRLERIETGKASVRAIARRRSAPTERRPPREAGRAGAAPRPQPLIVAFGGSVGDPAGPGTMVAGAPGAEGAGADPGTGARSAAMICP